MCQLWFYADDSMESSDWCHRMYIENRVFKTRTGIGYTDYRKNSVDQQEHLECGQEEGLG